MEQMILHLLADYPIFVFFAVLVIAMTPGACVVRIRKLKRLIKTATVLAFGELGAVIFWILSHMAKSFGVDFFLADFTVLPLGLAILFLSYAIAGHMLNWDHRIVRGLKKEA